MVTIAACTIDTFDHTGACYWSGPTGALWKDAWQLCYNDNGRLAIIEDVTTREFLAE